MCDLDTFAAVDLDLLRHARTLRRRERGGVAELWCAVRRAWYVAQPEELVRQALIAHLSELGYPTALMQVERRVGRTADRLDLLALSRDHTPFLLVECKAPGLDLGPAVLQLARYNRHWRAPYALAVNGSDATCVRLEFDEATITAVAQIPSYPAR